MLDTPHITQTTTQLTAVIHLTIPREEIQRFFVQVRGLQRGEEVKSSAEEEDSDAVVEEVTEPSGIGLEGLDFGVKPLGNSISDWEENEVKQTVEMAFKHTGHLRLPNLTRQNSKAGSCQKLPRR